MKKRYTTVFLYCGILMLISEIWKQLVLTYLLGDGHYNWWYFPFQLCSIPMYICLFIPYCRPAKLQKILLTFLMDYGLLAGIFTFCDTSGLRYSYAPLTIHSYAWHILLIALGLYAGYTKKADYSLRGFAGSTGVYLACALAATFCNLAFYSYGSINMFYISPHYLIRQKFFRHIAAFWGNGTGIFSYLCATIFGAYILHRLWAAKTKSGANVNL